MAHTLGIRIKVHHMTNSESSPNHFQMWTHLSHTHPVLSNGAVTMVKVLKVPTGSEMCESRTEPTSVEQVLRVQMVWGLVAAGDSPLKDPHSTHGKVSLAATSMEVLCLFSIYLTTAPVRLLRPHCHLHMKRMKFKKKKCFEPWTNLNLSSRISLLSELSILKVDKYQRSFFSP